MTNSPTLISLFTGAGGLDIGLELAGFNTLVANEITPYACQTLKANKVLSALEPNEFESWFKLQISQRCYKNLSENEINGLKERLLQRPSGSQTLRHAAIIESDIRKVTSADFLRAAKIRAGKLDLIAGGPPCQPFSRAGKRENVECENGRLFMEFVRVVRDLKPRWFLFENVKGLVITKADVAKVTCRKCGTTDLVPFESRNQIPEGESHIPCANCQTTPTSVTWSNVTGGSLEIIVSEFERIGYRCYFRVLNAADYGAPQLRERLIIVGSRDGEDFIWPEPTHGSKLEEENQIPLFQSGKPPRITLEDAIWSKGHWRYGKLDRNKAVLWVKNVVRPHDEPVTWSLQRSAPTIGAHQGAKLALAPYGVPEEQLKRQQWHVLGRRQGDTPPVFVEHEYLTDEELLALQTFPRSWYLFGTRMERAFQIGNAVPPILAAAVGRALLTAMGINEKDNLNAYA